MLDTGLVNHNISNYIRFKKADDVIKSDWQASFWCRRQVRVRVGSSGELSVQTLVQNRFAQLISSILKSLSCGPNKSFGKQVVSYANSDLSLPADVAVPLSETKQKEMIEIQCKKLALILLPTQTKLCNLGTQLLKYALSRTLHPKACRKSLEMNEEILTLVYPMIQHFQSDIDPADLHALLPEYEVNAQSMLERLPKALETFIDELLEEEARIAAEEQPTIIDEPVTVIEEPVTIFEEPVDVVGELVVEEQETAVEEPVVEEPATIIEESVDAIEEPVVEEQETAIEESVDEPANIVEEPVIAAEEPILEKQETAIEEPVVDEPATIVEETEVPAQAIEMESPETIPEIEITQPPVIPTTPKGKYQHLLDMANSHVKDLISRNQFVSAELLEKQINQINDQLSSKDQDENSIKFATESLENALDSTEQNMSFMDQLQAIDEDSQYEDQLKKLIVKDIRETLTRFNDNFESKIKDIAQLDIIEGPWHQTLRDFYKTIKDNSDELKNKVDTTLSNVPFGLQTFVSSICAIMRLVDYIFKSKEPLVVKFPLEVADVEDFKLHMTLIDAHCTALHFLENETKVERILNFRKEYKELMSSLAEKCEQLEQNGQYYHLAVLEKVKNKQDANIRKAAASLSDASACKLYAFILAMAVADVKRKLDGIENHATDPFQQLTGLKQLSSPYYETLHQQIVGSLKEKLESYAKTLNGYQNTLSVYLPTIEENHSELVEPLKAIEAKIRSEIAEAKALSVDYTTRLHFWQIFGAQVPLNELPPSKLKEYADRVSLVVASGMEEIAEDAAAIGFKFD